MGSVHINTKERQVRRVKEKKRIEAQRVKHPTPSQAIDGLIGDEEQNRKQKKGKQVLEPFNRLLQHAGIIQ